MTQPDYHLFHCMDGTIPGEWRGISPDTPFLPVLAAELFRLFSAPEEARGRNYQRGLIQRGFFTIPSPWTGEPIPSGDSVILPGRETFYRFLGHPDLLIGSANEGRGYPLLAVVLRNCRLIIHIGESTWGITAKHVLAAEKILQAPQWDPPRRAEHIHLFTGDPSYAHHAWNQLSALEMLLKARLQEHMTVSATFQPLGPIHLLYPRILPEPVPLEDPRIPFVYNKPGHAEVNPGGFLLTASIRMRILKLALRRSSETVLCQARRLARHHWPVVWISVRSINRTAVNQHEALVALCCRLLETYPSCGIVLDGFSLPDDFRDNPHYSLIGDMEAWSARDREAVERIVIELRGQGWPKATQLILPAAGLNILESVALAHTAHFYFCHHGTVQHKIGWLTDTPGIVHSNPRNIVMDPAPWVAMQAEGVHVPDYVSASLVGDVGEDISNDEEVKSRLFENYRFVDIKKLTDYVMEHLQRVLQAQSVRCRIRQKLLRYWIQYRQILRTART